MSGRPVRTAVLLIMATLGARAVRAQTIHRELGLQEITLFGDRVAVGAGGYWAARPSTRARVSLFAGGGRVAGRGFARGELLAHFLLAPGKRRGAAPYVAGGLAVDAAARTEARLVAVLGLEGRPGARAGWVVEGGVGGGWRVSAGWRWRR